MLSLDDRVDRGHKLLVVGRRKVHPWEEVGSNAVEKRHVVGEELWDVDVADRAEDEDVLVLLGEGALQIPRRREHRLDGAHPVVVVVLRGELL